MMIFFGSKLHVTLNGGLVFLIIDVITALNMNCTSPQTALINEETSLNCYIEQLNGDEVLSVIWEKGTRVLIKYPRRSIKKKETEEAKFALEESHIHQGDISLTIKNVLQSDEGNYWYSLRTKRESLQGAVKLRVLAHIRVNCKNPQTAEINTNFTLNCTTLGLNGEELTFVHWYKENTFLAVYPDNGNHNGNNTLTRFKLNENRIKQGDFSLDIAAVDKSDEGNYQYLVSTGKVIREGEVFLKVKMRSEMKCPSPQTAFLNMNTSIKCRIENLNSDKVTYVFWTKDDNILASYPRKESPTLTETGKSRFALDQDRVSQGDISLYISDVQNTDGGLYRYSLGTESTREEGGVTLEIFFPKVARSRTSTVITVCAVVIILACMAIAAFSFFRRRGTTEESARNPENLQLEVHEAQDEELDPL
ncbi:uncharacterized protein LOC120536729 [Polypterus senegalus]|uniref:uncharacterized protein LOC120536729 n=1 Tax=Polypterus senegalus TaxID=55291 RepID=UPI001964465E|nr:uncharacterized protein LOC120536729 [Polypterus senegalus]XP_039621130.1 uncharacterized protein LOC120536729 [Polypterus senegalus]